MDNIDGALSKFERQYACSQAILTQYAPIYGLDENLALCLAAGFAGGMRKADTCGVVTGSIMVLGLHFGTPESSTGKGRRNVYQAVETFQQAFVARCGSLYCRALLGCNIRTSEGMKKAQEEKLFQTVCPHFIRTAAELLEQLTSGHTQPS
ncbi:C-GCAxxG-C-C family protein [Desulfogranum japonicum]|uniref:C-GCAxxG-C-C family protein n=1 Tax=Desulfogranum japonicum TaxID=231447 RepID=UPI0003FC6275|nr:C-GCAxxG-C-C family protein [Desulfogranum japonicum]